MKVTTRIVNEAVKCCLNDRNKVIILLIYYTAATPKQIRYLKYEDFFVFANKVKITGVLYDIPGELMILVSEFVAQNRLQKGYLFLTSENEHITDSGISQIVIKSFDRVILKRKNITSPQLPKITPHNLRVHRIRQWRRDLNDKEALRLSQMKSFRKFDL